MTLVTARDGLAHLIGERGRLREAGELHDARVLDRIISGYRRLLAPEDRLDRRREDADDDAE